MPEAYFDVTTFGEILMRLSVPSGNDSKPLASLIFIPPVQKPMSSRCLLVWEEKRVGAEPYQKTLPALSASCRENFRKAIRRANERGVSISFDINHRQK